MPRGFATSARRSRPASRPRGAARSGSNRASAPNVRDALEAKGHRLVKATPGGFGGYQAIRIDLEHGV